MLQQANKFIKKYSLTRKNLTSDTLLEVFEKLGYQVIWFNKNGNSPEVNEIIVAYKLKEYIASRKAFIFHNPNLKLVFIREHICEDNLVYYMLHELGHIWLHHINTVDDEDDQEREAVEFAVGVKLIINYRNRFRFIAMILMISILLNSAYFVNKFAAATPAPQNKIESVVKSPPMPTYQIETKTETVFVTTAAGEKFHRADCTHIQNKTNLVELSREEAVNLGYEPCKSCKP